MKKMIKLLLVIIIVIIQNSCQIIGRMALGKQKNFDKFTANNNDLYKKTEEKKESEKEQNLWINTHKSGGLYEDRIQYQFATFLNGQCNCAPEYNKNIDYIPTSLRNYFYEQDLKNNKVKVFDKISLANILLTPLDDKKKNSLKNGNTTSVFATGNPLNVNIDYYKSPIGSNKGKSSYFYSATCSNYLDTKLSVGAGNKEASKKYLKAVMEAESKHSSTIIGYGGFFDSPIAEALQDPIYHTFINGYIWNLYASSSSPYDLKSNKRLYYISGIEGSTFSRSTLNNKKFLLEGKGALNKSLGVADIDANVKLGLTADQLTESNNYDTYLLNSFTDDLFKPFDSPQEIATHYSGLVPNSINTGLNEEFFENKIHTVSFEYKGIPEPLCSSEYWKIENPKIKLLDQSMKEIYNSVPKLYAESNGTNGCIFKISGIANKDFFNTPINKTNLLKFNIVLTSKKSVDSLHLKLFINEITTYTNLDPSLSTAYAPSFTKTNPYYKWEFDAIFSDSQGVVDYSRNPNSVLVESVTYNDEELKNIQTPQINASGIGVSNNKFQITLNSNIPQSKIENDPNLVVSARLLVKISFFTKSSARTPAALIDRYVTVITNLPKPIILAKGDVTTPSAN